ncbi:MAG: TonB-dependent receptor [Ignavibacteriales bacterium]|nr:MAG: TonB-dependent receptor [Ignavibacteriales bacterium]
MITTNKIFAIIIICLWFTVESLGQGILRGVITDSLSEKPLIGANVYLIGTSLGAAADMEGQYIVRAIPEGSYILKVSYIGYKPKEIPIQISNNSTTELNTSLSLDVIEGQEVVVTGQMMGQISAINQQRTSNTIINVVSEEKIKELADVNAAETIGRLPGVSILRSGGEANKIILRGLDSKFTNITIDGIKVPPTDATSRGVDLSMISQSSLAGIELYKALTPDKDGDALAGSVNLVTRKAPEVRKLRTDLKGGFNNLMHSANQYDFSFQYGERFFSNVLGVQLFGNLENRIRSNERINVDYGDSDTSRFDYHIENFLLEFTDEIRKREGFSIFLDFNTPDDGTIRFNNVYSKTNRNYFWSTRDYPTRGGGTFNGQTVYNHRDREQDLKTINSSIRGDNNLLGFGVSWGLSFAQSESEFPFDYGLLFVEPNGMGIAPEIKTNPAQLIPYAVNNFGNADLQWAYYRTQDNFDKERTAFIDISKDYEFGKLFSGQFKIGGKYKTKDRSNSRTEDFTPYYLGRWFTHERLPDGTFRPKDFTGTYFEDWWRGGGGTAFIADFLYNNSNSRDVYGSYALYPLIMQDRLRQWWDLNKYGVDPTGNELEVWENPLIRFDDYFVTERVSAAYLMNTLKIGQIFTLIAGLRVEREENDYASVYMTRRAQGFPPPNNVFADTTSSYSQNVLLPNFNLSFKPYEFMNLRIAVYKALSRPDFNMRIDRLTAGRPAESTSDFVVFVGNPNLKTAQAWNYEINTSFYGNEIGLISVSAYYKEIKDMYHMLNNFVSKAVRNEDGVLTDTLMRKFGINWPNLMGSTPYNLTFPYNSPEATKVWGFEFEHQINFHFLPGLLRNFVLTYNASLVRSETTLYGQETISYIDSIPIPHIVFTNILVTKKQRLEGMPDFYGNISLGYDIEGFSVRLSLFHKGKHIDSFDADGNNVRETLVFNRIDLAMKQKINDNLSFFLNINNLTNSEDGYTRVYKLWNSELFDQSEKYGLTADFGLTLEL